MTDDTALHTPDGGDPLSPLGDPRKLTARVLKLNAFVFIIIIMGFLLPLAAFMGGTALVLYLLLTAIRAPEKTIFLIFGIKLTFDALWFVQSPVFGSVRLTELIVLPILVALFTGVRNNRMAVKWPLWYALIFVLWNVLVMLVNDRSIDAALLVRLSGSLIGLAIGLKFVVGRERAGLLMRLIFISTLIPIAAAVFQFALSQAGVSILHYKMDTFRDFRPSGLYFDAATMGMVSIISILSSMYLLNSAEVKGVARKFVLGIILLAFVIIAVGGTRSMLVTSLIICVVFLTSNLRQAVKILPLAILVVWFSKPYMAQMVEKSVMETKGKVEVSKILYESRYRQMFTGRVSLWQDILKKYERSTILQQIFGAGIPTNSHSSYFFLLLHIGALGLLYYLFFQGKLFSALAARAPDREQKIHSLTALGALLLVGTSATTVAFTSFQWVVYIIVGGAIGAFQEWDAAPKVPLPEQSMGREE